MAKKKTNTKKENEPTAQKEQQELSPEEIKSMQDDTIAFYTRQMEVLKPQLEYEKMMAELEKARLDRLVHTVHRAQMMMKPEDPDDESEDDTTEPIEKDNREVAPRRLKREVK